jgi:hypothetical protein
MGPRNAYKDMLDNVVSPIACVSMNHQNQLEQMANVAMFATISSFLVIYDNTSKASINLQKLTKLKSNKAQVVFTTLARRVGLHGEEEKSGRRPCYKMGGEHPSSKCKVSWRRRARTIQRGAWEATAVMRASRGLATLSKTMRLRLF